MHPVSPAPSPAQVLPETPKPVHSNKWHAIAWVLALTLVHGSLYAAVVPPWQVPDENVHYEYLRGLVRAPTIFPSVLDRSAAVFQQVMASFLTFRWWEFLRVPTPAPLPSLPPSPVIAARGGWSLYYRLSVPLYLAVSAWPIVNQLYVLRLYSVALQCLTVWLTYHLARLIFPDGANPVSTLVPVASAFVVAIFPQYTFISAGYNDDNLMPPLVTASLYTALKGLSNQGDYRWLGLASGLAFLAILTKRTALSLIVLIGICLLAYAIIWQRSPRRGRRAAGIAVLIGAALAGLVLIALVVRPPQLPAPLAALFSVRTDDWSALAVYAREPGRLLMIDWTGPILFLSISFWGWFGWLKAPLGTHLMEILRRVTLLMVAGCGIDWVWRGLAARPRFRLNYQSGALLLLGLGLVLSLVLLVAQFLIGPPVYALTGRYLFPFISAFGILAVWGWQAWWPARWKVQGIILGLVLLSVVDFAALALTIIPFFYS
jgi:hypothetical protein